MSRRWVIGGSSGIGLAIAQESERAGYEVRASGLDADVRSAASLFEFYRKHGPFESFVYCAGVNRLQWIKDVTVQGCYTTFDVNTFGFIRLLSLLTNHQEGGRVLAVTSDAAVRPMRTSITYCASKAALDASIKVAARELAPNWIVNGIAPGMTEPTGMQQYIDQRVPEIRGWDPEKAREYEASQIPMGRRAYPLEIADVALKILEAPSYMTGSIVYVNGGR